VAKTFAKAVGGRGGGASRQRPQIPLHLGENKNDLIFQYLRNISELHHAFARTFAIAPCLVFKYFQQLVILYLTDSFLYVIIIYKI
jgi:hypothetical protein